MYGPKWPFLLMYGFHDMRHTGFPRVDGLSTDPRDLGRHSSYSLLDISLGVRHMAPMCPLLFCLLGDKCQL